MLNTFPSVRNYDTTWLKVHIRSEHTLLFGVVYRSASSKTEDNSVFISTIPCFIYSQKCIHLLLVGDFNAPQAEWVPCSNKNTGFSYSLSQLIRDESWFQHVKQPTRFRYGQKPSLLELVITDEQHFIDNIDVKATFGKSDHATLEFEFICYWTQWVTETRYSRNFSKANLTSLRKFLGAIPGLHGYVEDINSTITEAVHETDKLYVPRTNRRRLSPNKLPKRIRRRLDSRNQLFAKYKTTGSDADSINFRKIRNKCKQATSQFRRNSQTQLFQRSHRNKKMLFKYIRHQRINKPLANTLKLKNGTPSTDSIKVTELFREFFASVHETAFMNSERLDSRDVHTPMPDLQFTKEDIFRLLRASNPFCSMGSDEIHFRILKGNAYELAGPFYTLIQQSLNSGSLPHSWKAAHITPIFESGGRLSPTSYRSISLTSIPCKIFE